MSRRLLAETRQKMVLFLILMSILVPSSSFLGVTAQGTTEITSMSPTTGIVGTQVTIIANITTTGGPYTIKLDTQNLTTGVAEQNSLRFIFTVPETYGGNHTVAVFDDTTQETAQTIFVVAPSYVVSATVPSSPLQLQEGASVPIVMNITGAGQGEKILANFTVQTPGNVTHEKLFNATASLLGSNLTTISFPNDFLASANTSLVGTYMISLNDDLASSNFTIGLTNSTQYHRGQTVDVKALYSPGENISLSISGKNTNFAQNLTADAVTGLVSYSGFAVPSDAQVNNSYMINVTSASNQTVKSPADVQNFTIPGFPVNFTMNNLAGFPVAGATLNINENGGTVNVTSGNSGADGLITLNIEAGTYGANATYKSKKVGDYADIVVSEVTPPQTLECNLTSIGIKATDTSGSAIPSISLKLIEVAGNQTTVLNSTDVTGISLALSLLPNLTYAINASRYTTQFNETTIENLPIEAWYNISITVPTYTLQLSVYGASGQPLSSVTARASELSGGVIKEVSVTDGQAQINCTLGLYHIQILVYGVILNETDLSLNETVVNASIVCNFYGLGISLRVTDYFGQPVTNANVTVSQGLWVDSGLTGSDGTIVFANAVGGEVQTIVTLPGQAVPYAMNLYFFDTTHNTTTISASRYVSIGGSLVEVNVIVTLLLILASVMVVAIVEIYKWRRSKTRKAESNTENP